MGQWWLPAAPQRRVGGVLDIDTSKPLRLELTDALIDDNSAAGPIPREAVTWGAAGGKQITLLECWPGPGTRRSFGQEINHIQVVQVRVVLVGVHLNSASDAVFHGGEATMTGLTAWAVRSGIQVFPFPAPGTAATARLEFHSVNPVEAQVTEPAPWTLSLHWRHPLSSQTDIDANSRTYPVTETVVLQVKAETPQRWNAFQDPWIAVRDLVTVATQHPSAITSHRLWIDQRDIAPPVGVDLYYATAGDPERAARKFDFHSMIFPLAGQNFAAIIRKWFALRESLGLSLDLLLGVDYHHRGYYVNQLFDVAAAAEGFHTALCPGSTDLPTEDHAVIQQVMGTVVRGLSQRELHRVMGALETIDQPLQDRVRRTLGGLDTPRQREWVSNKIGFNRPGLKSRYMELAQTRADPLAVSLLLTDIQTWAQWLRTARNAVGHVNSEHLERIPESARWQLMYVTRALLHLVLLAELGSDADTQQALADRDDVWGYRARQFREAVMAVQDSTSHNSSTSLG